MDNYFEAANLHFVIIALLGLYMNIRWRRYGLSKDTREAIVAWNWVYLAMGVRALWFYATYALSGPHVKWQPLLFEYRIWIIVGTSAAFGYGVLRFINIIENRGTKWITLMFGGLAALALLLGHLL